MEFSHFENYSLLLLMQYKINCKVTDSSCLANGFLLSAQDLIADSDTIFIARKVSYIYFFTFSSSCCW